MHIHRIQEEGHQPTTPCTRSKHRIHMTHPPRTFTRHNHKPNTAQILQTQPQLAYATPRSYTNHQKRQPKVTYTTQQQSLIKPHHTTPKSVCQNTKYIHAALWCTSNLPRWAPLLLNHHQRTLIETISHSSIVAATNGRGSNQVCKCRSQDETRAVTKTWAVKEN